LKRHIFQPEIVQSRAGKKNALDKIILAKPAFILYNPAALDASYGMSTLTRKEGKGTKKFTSGMK
jgi:hypothetical protein